MVLRVVEAICWTVFGCFLVVSCNASNVDMSRREEVVFAMCGHDPAPAECVKQVLGR